MVALIVHDGSRPYVSRRIFETPEEAIEFREDHRSDPGVSRILTYSDVETLGEGLADVSAFARRLSRRGWSACFPRFSSMARCDRPWATLHVKPLDVQRLSMPAWEPGEACALLAHLPPRRVSVLSSASSSSDPFHSRRRIEE